MPRSALPGVHIEYTGVGKVNAAVKAAEVIERYQPKMIVNYGTAGGLTKDLDGLYEVGTFKQRDMDATGLGFEMGETPFDAVKDISFGREGVSCGSGDSFVNETPKVPSDLVDMEAYAIAKACHLKGTDFRCFKYVSDNANEDAADAWKENIANGKQAFQKEFSSFAV